MMSVARSVAEVLQKHVTLAIEGIDRLYLNAYVPKLQHVMGAVSFFRFHHGYTFASSALMEPITKRFIAAIDRFVRDRGIDLITFAKGERKDDIAARYRAACPPGRMDEGVLFVGKAQEKATVFRTEKRHHPETGRAYPWIVRTTALVNHYYFYCVDRDFGPFFLKFCSYFPYTAKLCLNGHEYLKRQLTQEGIAFEALDNGLLRCADPERAQAICDDLSAERIDAFFRKWLAILPHPFSAEDRRAGYQYELSILQVELSLTQVLDRPLTGRIFFESVIRENLDLGRPDQVQLLFGRRVGRRTPGRFRTRVITDGVVPSLHVDYKRARIKQYHKEGRALRTETTINNTRDFAIGKRLHNLPALREIGFAANRRLLDVERTSQDCTMDEDHFGRLNRPLQVGTQRTSALHFADPVVQGLFSTLVLFTLLPRGFTNRELRERLAPVLGLPISAMTPGRTTYQLRRLRLHGLIERQPRSHRYRVTSLGLRTAVFCTRTYQRLLRPGYQALMPASEAVDSDLRRHFTTLEAILDHRVTAANLAA
jgi:hypothetical protein